MPLLWVNIRTEVAFLVLRDIFDYEHRRDKKNGKNPAKGNNYLKLNANIFIISKLFRTNFFNILPDLLLGLDSHQQAALDELGKVCIRAKGPIRPKHILDFVAWSDYYSSLRWDASPSLGCFPALRSPYTFIHFGGERHPVHSTWRQAANQEATVPQTTRGKPS